jgi:hypothetical protein
VPIDDDGRGRGARALKGLQIAHVDALGFEAGAHRGAGGIVASSAPELGLAAQARDRHGGIRRHAAAGLDVLQGAHFAGLWRKGLDAIDAIERRMPNTDDPPGRCHAFAQRREALRPFGKYRLDAR